MKCANSESRLPDDECGKPATWIGITRYGFHAHFCDHCKEHGRERVGIVAWHRAPVAEVLDLESTAPPTPIPTSSPWGFVEYHDVLAEGIVFVSTASHGGIKLSETRIAEMPADERKASGWYEEDCEAVFVLRHFADAKVIEATDEDRDRYRRICNVFTSFDNIRMAT